MKFDDYKILSDRDYTIMKQNYDTLIQSETNDLSEILDKLYKQRQNLIDLNQNHKFDDMLEKIDNNISDIESIIGSNQKIASTKQSCEIPHYWGLKKPSKQDINSDNTNGNNSFSDLLDNEYKNNPIPTPTQPPLDNNLAPNIFSISFVTTPLYYKNCKRQFIFFILSSFKKKQRSGCKYFAA